MKPALRMVESAELIIHDGMSQQQRVLPALEPGYFNVDEMSFSTLLAMAVDYAGRVNFYNLHNRPDGVWTPYFSADETVVIANILATDLNQFVAAFEFGLSEAGGNPARFLQEADLPQDLVNTKKVSAYTLAKMLDVWFALLGNVESSVGVELRRLIESVLEGLRGELQAFKQLLIQTSASGEAIEKIFSYNFCNAWFNNNGVGAHVSSHDEPDGITVFSLRSNFHSFVKAIEMIKAGAVRLLPASMKNQTHDPAAGLLIAFVKLFQNLQKRINRFTQNHLDFYYDQILMARPRDLVPDCAFLVIRPSVKGGEVVIPQDTEFLAGVDENKRDIIYAAEHGLAVNDAVVSSLHTLFFKRDRLNFPENKFLQKVGKKMQQLATACYLEEISADPDSEIGNRNKMRPLPLLGAPKSTADIVSTPSARIGFAIASKVLMLKEGQRSISIFLQFDSTDIAGAMTLEEQLSKLTAILKQTGERGSTAVDSDQETFFRIFQDMFTLELTTATGWLAVPEYLPSYSRIDQLGKANSLTLKFSLPSDIPAISAYSPLVHGENYDTELAVVRCTLNPNTYLYAYDFLRNFALREIRIDVDVRGCRDLLLYNQVGQLSALAPFTPFGPIPALGSYLIIGSAEIAGKELTSFDIDVEWGGLPTDIGGFKTYYGGYGSVVENTDMQANVAVLVNGKWIPTDSGALTPIALFDTETDDDSLSIQSNLSCSDVIHYFKPLEKQKNSAAFSYTPSSKGGFFKFTLASPRMAFGHQEYPTVLANALTYNSRQKTSQSFETIPNPPYTPVITSIEAHYSAFSNIGLTRGSVSGEQRFNEQFIQLHPMGWENMASANYRSMFLLPQYNASGNLFIGLRGTRVDGILTLFFHLREDSLPMEGRPGMALEWSYLAGNSWIPLTEKQIISDSTEGFMTSGIVTLDLPPDISRGSTIMPGDLFWIGVSAQYDLEKYCSVYSVYAQALKVSWRKGDHAPSWMPVHLPAATISRSKKTIPGIAKIIQIKHSFGGRAQESRSHMRTRLGERLKHKNRALLATDYEMLILEQFPEIYRVKCFANMVADPIPEKRIRPGHILIVAVPYLSMEGHLNQMPMLSGHLVNEVKEFVMRLAPQFATIKVKNPVYEQIQVRCTVKLKRGLRGGQYTNMLNQAISDFLSPWKTPGYATHFGWCIRQHDLESYIQDQDYIDSVTNFSILRVAPDGDDNFDLMDTASVSKSPERYQSITPKYPWSIAVPLKHHAIGTTDDFKPTTPIIAGVDELEIGTTFIVSSGN
jgi:hypothetical protein